jgi:hypothetical protein
VLAARSSTKEVARSHPISLLLVSALFERMGAWSNVATAPEARRCGMHRGHPTVAVVNARRVE